MKKSSALTPSPMTVVTEMRPDVAPLGTLVEIDVAVAAVMSATVPLNFKRLLDGTGSKFCPVTVTAVPDVPILGVKPVMIGPFVPTTNGSSLESDPAEVVTEINPVVAPAGTEVTICVSEDEDTTAAVPLKVTVLPLGVGLKPVP